MDEEKKKRTQKESGTFDPWGKACVDHNERLLIKGPDRRWEDMKRLSNIGLEFMSGFEAFRDLGPCVTFFGSARFREDHRYYDLARRTARLVAKLGLTVMTGGGPGIMEAANRGAKEAGGTSIGCNITLPLEQEPNSYLDQFVEFNHFYVRKVMLLRYSYAFVIMPGGFGTLDEVFETITLIQTKKISDFPITMMGLEFWQPLKNFIFDTLLKNNTISLNDLHLVHFTDDPEEAVMIIHRYVEKRFELKSHKAI